MHNDMSYVTEAFARGASGYLLKECSPEELLFAIKYIARNGQYLSAELAVKLPGLYSAVFAASKSAPLSDIQFTERELEVMRLIGEGMTNNEISDYLFLSKRTVEGHRQSLLEKTGCRNTAVLVKFAVQNGLIK
jgi:DNA-binding NarL/FixJ family response regulator